MFNFSLMGLQNLALVKMSVLTKELRQKIVSYLFYFPCTSSSLGFRLTTLITRATTRGSLSLGLSFRSISLSTTSQIGQPAEAFGYCYYQNEIAHEVIKLLHHRCWMRKICTLLMFGFLLGMLTSLTNAHAVGGRPTQNYNNEHFSARSFRELKENSMRAMKANYEAMTNSELSLKPNFMHMNTTNSCIVSYCCHSDPKTEVNTRILYSDKTDASLDTSSQQFVQDNTARIKEVIRIFFFIAAVCILKVKVVTFAIVCHLNSKVCVLLRCMNKTVLGK